MRLTSTRANTADPMARIGLVRVVMRRVRAAPVCVMVAITAMGVVAASLPRRAACARRLLADIHAV